MTPEGRQDLARELEARIYVAEHIFDRSGGQRVRVHVPLELAKSLLALLLAEAQLQDQENQEVARVEDSQYPSKPLATASSIETIRAEAIARAAHVGQVEESTGDDYMRHIERVVALVDGDEAKAVAWLHDVLEDVLARAPQEPT